MEEYDDNLAKIGIVADELVALLPEEPSTELEAKVAEMVALVIAHMEMLSMAEAEGEDAAVEADAEAEVEAAPVDVEAA